MTTTTVRCGKCRCLCMAHWCDTCGAPPMIAPPRVPAPRAAAKPEPLPANAKERAAAQARDTHRALVEQYQREHPGASAREAALEALKAQRRARSAEAKP